MAELHLGSKSEPNLGKRLIKNFRGDIFSIPGQCTIVEKVQAQADRIVLAQGAKLAFAREFRSHVKLELPLVQNSKNVRKHATGFSAKELEMGIDGLTFQIYYFTSGQEFRPTKHLRNKHVFFKVHMKQCKTSAKHVESISL